MGPPGRWTAAAMGHAVSHCKNDAQCGPFRLDGAIEVCAGPMDPDGDVRDSHALMNHKLLKAAREGHLEEIQRALEGGAFIETRRPFIMTLEKVELMESGHKLRGVGLTPLMCAAEEGYAAACELLITKRAAVNSEDEDGMRPLHFAAFAGSTESCRALLCGGANPHARDDDGRLAIDHVPPQCISSRDDKKRWNALFSSAAHKTSQEDRCRSVPDAESKVHAERIQQLMIPAKAEEK